MYAQKLTACWRFSDFRLFDIVIVGPFSLLQLGSSSGPPPPPQAMSQASGHVMPGHVISQPGHMTTTQGLMIQQTVPLMTSGQMSQGPVTQVSMAPSFPPVSSPYNAVSDTSAAIRTLRLRGMLLHMLHSHQITD